MAWDDVLSRTMGGAGLGGSVGGPIGAGIGAAGGLLWGLLGGGGGGPQQPNPTGYDPNAAAFAGIDPYAYMAPGGAGNYFANEQWGALNGVPGVPQSARSAGLLDESAREQDAMGWLSQLASGQDSMARREGALQRQQLGADIMSQAAAASQGRYNPALQRQAMLQRSQLGSQLAGQTALNAAKEQMAARQAYAQAVAQQQQNRALWNQVATQAYGAQTGRMMGQNQIKQGWMAMALDQAERDRQAKIMLEQMRAQAGENSANRQYQDYVRQSDAAARKKENMNLGWMNMGQAGLANLSRWGKTPTINVTTNSGIPSVQDKVVRQAADDIDDLNYNW